MPSEALRSSMKHTDACFADGQAGRREDRVARTEASAAAHPLQQEISTWGSADVAGTHRGQVIAPVTHASRV
jgi:hypothetical protein